MNLSDHYIEANRDLLPEGFGREQVEVAQNCPQALAEIRLVIDLAEARRQSPLKSVPCESKSKAAK